MTKFQRLALVTVVATYLLVVIGGTVRVTDSGLSCPDWPLCKGQLIPPFDEHVLLEWFHRLFATLVSTLIAVLALSAWRRYRSDHTVLWLANAVVGVLIVQIVLGGLTVTQKLTPEIVTAHLGTGMALLGTATLLAAVSLSRTRTAPARARGGRRFAAAALAGAGGMYALLLSGAYVAASNAGLSCSTTWPLCNSQILPQGTRDVWLNFSHRIVVLIVSLAMAVLVFAALRWLREHLALRRTVWAAAGLFIAQIVLGGANVMSSLATPVRVLHLATGAALWTVLVTIAWLGQLAAQRRPAPALQPAVHAQRTARPPEVLG